MSSSNSSNILEGFETSVTHLYDFPNPTQRPPFHNFKPLVSSTDHQGSSAASASGGVEQPVRLGDISSSRCQFIYETNLEPIPLVLTLSQVTSNVVASAQLGRYQYRFFVPLSWYKFDFEDLAWATKRDDLSRLKLDRVAVSYLVSHGVQLSAFADKGLGEFQGIYSESPLLPDRREGPTQGTSSGVSYPYTRPNNFHPGRKGGYKPLPKLLRLFNINHSKRVVKDLLANWNVSSSAGEFYGMPYRRVDLSPEQLDCLVVCQTMGLNTRLKGSLALVYATGAFGVPIEPGNHLALNEWAGKYGDFLSFLRVGFNHHVSMNNANMISSSTEVDFDKIV
jgi:hypothetical protein